MVAFFILSQRSFKNTFSEIIIRQVIVLYSYCFFKYLYGIKIIQMDININRKLSFLLNGYVEHLKKLDPELKGVWGKMNVQQMIEHMTESLREANGKTPRTIISPIDRVDAMKEFIKSENEFRPNTKNSMMGETPLPLRNLNVKEAIDEIVIELKDFEKYFENNPDSIIVNPFFGELNFEEWIQLIHKHAMHHLRQFGVSLPPL